MAFKASLKKYILPFPDDLPMHDQWIGLIGEIHGKNKLIYEPLLLYRRHGFNMSSTTHSNPSQMLKWRKSILFSIIRHKIKHHN